MNNKYSNLTFNIDSNIKQIALTYDCDDLDYEYVSKILDVLKKHEIKCTFFLTGLWTKKFSKLAQRIAYEGHEIGNHSYEHPDMTKISYTEIKESVKKAEEIIKKVAGINPQPLFRAPYGYWSSEILRAVGAIGYKYSLHWSIDTFDWQQPPAKTIVERIFRNIEAGDIILMHGHGSNTAYATDFVIETLKTFDFNFVTISELLNI